MGLSNFIPGNNDPNGGNGIIPGLGPFGGGNMQNDLPDPTDMLINYNEEFKAAGTVLYRDKLIQQTLAVMIGKNKPNALLIGPAGVGKTKIVEDIAYRLSSKDPLVPDKLQGYTIYELPLSNLVAGSGVLGDMEKKVASVVDFIEDPKNKAILFIDEIHQLVSTSQTYSKIAQILKPALARGKMHTIGATTTQEAKDLADDPAFNRRFSKLIVDELTPDQTLGILKQVKGSFCVHYNNKVIFDDDMLKLIVEFADQYKPAGSHRPDNALTLLDRTIGDAIINRRIKEVTAVNNNDTVAIAAFKANPFVTISEKQIRTTAIKLATGNSKPDTLDVDHLREQMMDIKGQDHIREQLIKWLRINDMNLFGNAKHTPLTMLFIGPSGVGKTAITEIISKEVTGVEPITLDMTEYNSPASINRIIGSPAGYVGSDSHAELPFDSLESNPYRVILLDEFEKCDPAVARLFMSAFDKGYIKTNKGSVIDFSKTIMIATTNAGHCDTKTSIGFGEKKGNESKAQIKKLSPYFDLALMNRFKKRVTFDPIDEATYREIIISKYEKNLAIVHQTNPHAQLPATIPDDELDNIVKETYALEFGARPAEDAVREYIANILLQ